MTLLFNLLLSFGLVACTTAFWPFRQTSGGIGPVTTPVSQNDPNVLIIAAGPIQEAFTEETDITPNGFVVVSYAMQFAAGTNYFAKVRYNTDPNKYAHIRVFSPLSYTGASNKLVAVQMDKSLDDPIEYFDAESDSSDDNVEGSSENSNSQKNFRGFDLPVVGGLGETKTPEDQNDADVVTIVSVREAFAKRTGVTPAEFHVVSYATQVVAGTNYFAKVRIDTDTYAHIRVLKAVPFVNSQPTLHSVQMGKSLSDPIVFFSRDSGFEPPAIPNRPLPGGLGETKIPTSQDDADVVTIASVRQAFAEKTGVTPEEFHVVSYATQIVAGTNYFAKVRIAPDSYVHIRVFKSLPFANVQPALNAVQMDKSLDDPIVFFSQDSGIERTPERTVFPGGLSEPKTPTSQQDDDVKTITSVRDAFEKKTGVTPTEFYVVSYTTQVVAGTNYFAKVRIDTDTYVHIRVFKPMPFLNQNPSLHAVQMDKSLSDPITYFSSDSNVEQPDSGNEDGDSEDSPSIFDRVWRRLPFWSNVLPQSG